MATEFILSEKIVVIPDVMDAGDKLKIIRKWLKEHQGLVDLIAEFYTQVYTDSIIYGCCPWDYAEEFGLNLKYQKIK